MSTKNLSFLAMQKNRKRGQCDPGIEVILKIQKKSRDGCEQRIEVLLEMKKKSGSGGCDSSRAGGQVGGFDPRIEVIVKMQKVGG